MKKALSALVILCLLISSLGVTVFARYKVITTTNDDLWDEDGLVWCHASVEADFTTDLEITMDFYETNGNGWEYVDTIQDDAYDDHLMLDGSIPANDGYSYKVLLTYDAGDGMDRVTFTKYLNL